MPKSNSDADENDSLTSDEEAMGPTLARVNPEDVQPQPQSRSQSTPAVLNGVDLSAKDLFEDDAPSSSLQPPQRPLAKFRSSVNKIISINRAHSALLDLAPGTEPGADPRKSSTAEMFGHLKADCRIEMCEYGPSKARFTNFNNKEFVNWVTSPAATAKREIWNKVRWINIAGISWDVISALGVQYNLHPLAIEDILHGRKNARSKADYYSRHLFIHVLTHKLGKQEDDPDEIEGMVRTEEPLPISTRTSSSGRTLAELGDEAETETQGGWFARKRHSRYDSSVSADAREGSGWHAGKDIEDRAGANGDSRRPRLRASLNAALKAKSANQKAITELKKGYGRVYVDVASAWMFLFRDGTIISISQDLNTPFGRSVTDRLRVRDTVLRSSGDASLLLEGLLDLGKCISAELVHIRANTFEPTVVDNAVEVVDRYHDVILKMERAILLKPNMKTVRGLHIISGDLTLHKRTLGPLSQLVYGLRRYDVDRCKALAGSAGREGEVTGYLSHQAKVYLADVHDHVEYIMSSLDMFTSIAENLINYTFNIVSYETNQVMRGLTIATVIFFPLTFLTGYFGMNFVDMPSIEGSEARFWAIACPVMVFVIVAFLFPDIQKMIRVIKKRMATRQFDYK